MDEKQLQIMADRLAIAELPRLYMRGLDRLDRELLRAQFWGNALLEYGIFTGGADDFADFCMDALSGHDANHHMLGQHQVEIDGDSATGEIYFQAYHRVTDENGQARDVMISGRYLDRYEKRDGVWKFTYRSEVVDWARDDPAADGFMENSGNIWGKRKPDDPLYSLKN